MKILLLADTHSQHTEKWALGLADKNFKIGLFSFNKTSYEWYNHSNITVFFEPEQQINPDSILTKLAYLKYVKILKEIISHFQPDILHAHYATSYGLIGALSRFKPFVLSVWGADVYDFPARSKLHKKLFQYNLKKASVILSTSHIMREEIKKYTSRDIMVTPFGVDTAVFSPRENPLKPIGTVCIGTIKPIEEKYGIIYIIEAAKILVEKHKNIKFKFWLVGAGKDLGTYRSKISENQLTDFFEVTGRVPFNEVSNYHNLLDIFLNVSVYDSESFGVATVEALACEKPVIVTDVGGLSEVVNHGEFGIIVPRRNAGAIASAVEQFLENPESTKRMAEKARQHVLKHYDWKNNIEIMTQIYNNLLVKSNT